MMSLRKTVHAALIAGSLVGGAWTANAAMLTVTSVTEADSGISVNKTTVRIYQADGTTLTNTLPEVGVEQTIEVASTAVVEIVAPRVVYRDLFGVDITDSVSGDPQLIQENAEERFTAIGISVNDTPQTGDPTYYRFTMGNSDVDLVVKWQHEFALTVSHDFGNTQSVENDAGGEPWAGPLNSLAEGKPVPEVKKHWYVNGATEIAEVDGQVQDFNRPGSFVRYVPDGYRAAGPPNPNTQQTQDEDKRRGGFAIEDFVDPPRLIELLSTSTNTLSVYLWSSFSTDDKSNMTSASTQTKNAALVDALNAVVVTDDLYSDTNRFTNVVLSAESQQLIAENPSDKTLLNRRLLEDAYASDIRKSALTENFVPFVVGQAPPARQHVPQFTMYGPGRITYRWQIQFGVQVNVDSPTRTTFPRIFRVGAGGADEEVGVGEGTFWFHPSEHLKVVAPANATDQFSTALTGWINGDGHYFSGAGNINAETGALGAGEGPVKVDDSPVAEWRPLMRLSPASGSISTRYRGLEITQLRRSAKVLWRYGVPEFSDSLKIGEYVFQGHTNLAFSSVFNSEPESITLVDVKGENKLVGSSDLTVWDPVAKRLYPVVPGEFVARWRVDNDSTNTVDVRVTSEYPTPAHYPHVAGTPPVALDPDPNDNFIFRELKYSESSAVVDGDRLFQCETNGYSVLLFSEIKRVGRGVPEEVLAVRVVKTEKLNLPTLTGTPRVIGKRIDDALDLAGLGTGYVFNPEARYNPYIYDASKLNGIAAKNVYDMDRLRLVNPVREIVNKSALPGPIIPVNLHPGSVSTNKLVVVWYDDPVDNDELLWPHAAKAYVPRWPVNQSEGLGRIVIASQYGSESQVTNLLGGVFDQTVVPAIGNAPAETTYNPSRLQSVSVYNQPDASAAGYNPNEEHGLIAPSLRYADVSPKPPAIYALRADDLNDTNNASYTSDPYVLVQFFDTADEEFKMRVYDVEKEDSANSPTGYRFADLPTITIDHATGEVRATPTALKAEPHVEMNAGEPVIPFYPLVHVIGASPTAETFGTNLKKQETYWEDHKGTSWSISGGTNAWFSQSVFYPLAPDFWWPPILSVPAIEMTRRADGSNEPSWDPSVRVGVPAVGDSVAFLPSDIYADGPEFDPDGAILVDPGTIGRFLPTPVLFKSRWPEIAPILKAGETLTFSGGEYRADNPLTPTLDADGNVKQVETPGLPGVLAFAAAEVIFDSLNPRAATATWATNWTARVAQVLDVRSVDLATSDFPSGLRPATGKTRVKQGKYVFTDLPASLQKRVRYDPLGGRLEVSGLVNDKGIGEPTLTAAPPAVYILEPNILTTEERNALRKLSSNSAWLTAVNGLTALSRNPQGSTVPYAVGLGSKGRPRSEFGPGLAVLPNSAFLDPQQDYPDVSWITLVENNHPSLGGSPVTPHIIKVDRRERYRGAIKTVASDNVFDENLVLRHQGDFGANADALAFEWWYRPDDGSLGVPPPDYIEPGQVNPWKIFPDTSGKQGVGRYQITLKGNPNAPEALLADTWWFARYRHTNDVTQGTDWNVPQADGRPRVNHTWAGAGNSQPFEDFDGNGIPDFKAQLAQGWIKRVLDAVNPYEARIRDFDGDNPSTQVSMISQFGQRFEGPVALNPDKNVIENVGLIELYETILQRGRDLSIDLSRPVATPAIANALQLASTRISDFYTILGNEAYVDALDPTIGFGSDSVEYGSLAPAVFTFQNQLASPIAEELGLLRGVDDYFARPVYNRMFWNFTKGEGEAAYAVNYNVSDVNKDGFVNEADAMSMYPQGHGDAWGHYTTALRNQYELLNHPFFNWVSRSEFYNLQDIVIKVDFLDERKFAQTAAAKAKAGSEIVSLTYREKYVEEPTAQWQGYADGNKDRSWGVQGWARRTGQGAYFDWVTSNALLPSEHPNGDLEGIQKVDRTVNSDIQTISANLNSIQQTFDDANKGRNPLGIAGNSVPFDLNPAQIESLLRGRTHFEQIYDRAVAALSNAKAVWDNANKESNRIRKIGNSEAEFRNSVFQEDLTYKNRLIGIFGRPYEGTVGPGKLYPAGYDGPDTALFMYVKVRQINSSTVPGPTADFASFSGNDLDTGNQIYDAFHLGLGGQSITNIGYDAEPEKDIANDLRALFAPTFAYPTNSDGNVTGDASFEAKDGWYNVNYTDLTSPKVPLENLDQLMPLTAAGYTFQAPSGWGGRPATGELQTVINQMIQKEADIAKAIGDWDGLSGEIGRTFRIVNARIQTGADIRGRNVALVRSRWIINNLIAGVEGAVAIIKAFKDTGLEVVEASKDGVPRVLPTGGFSISPGDALSPLRAGLSITKVPLKTASNIAEATLSTVKLLAQIGFDIYEQEVGLANAADESLQNKREWLKELEDLVGDEPVLRIAVFKEIEALRALSDRYQTLVNEGSRLIDERAAFNKRVAAQTQRNRYQDMTFRVSRNHAMQTYRSTVNVAARYIYQAAKAYDYETNFDPTDPGSPQAILSDIVKARGVGHFDGQPRLGKGGLSAALAWLKINYDAQKGQLGFNNPQAETGKMSLRTELFRILPKGATQPPSTTNLNLRFPSPGKDSDDLWQQVLLDGMVDDLWDVPEYRYYCRPFSGEGDDSGTHIAEPGIILRFSSEILAGNNFFGRPLSGGDHAYDPSRFATKIRAAGLWFDDYRSDDVLNDLPEAPRVYLVPIGSDVMSVPTSGDPGQVRIWNVVDEQIPVPLPAVTADLDRANWIPLLDSLNGRMGDPRRFSAMRAYHNGSDTLNLDELVFDSRLVGRSVWNTQWLIIIPGRTLNADPDEGLQRFIDQVSDIKLIFQTYGYSGG